MRTLKRKRGSKGFTLLEIMLVMAIMVLIVIGTENLFLIVNRTAVHTAAVTASSVDAMTALAKVETDVRLANWLALPDDVSTNFVAPTGSGYSASQFETTYSGYNIDTGLMLQSPPTTSDTVYGASSNSIAVTPWCRDLVAGQSGSSLWIYRSDAGGVPDASAGAYLWETGTENGLTVNRAIIKSVDASSANAVQFIRPSTEDYEVEVKIVSSFYDIQNGKATDESTNGSNVTSLTGDCTLMRNHETSGAHEQTPYTPSTGSATRWSAS